MEIVYTPKGYRGFKSLLLRHKDYPGIRSEYRDFSLLLRIFSALMLDIINLQKKDFCGFPLRFLLLTYGEYKLLHSCSTVIREYILENISEEEYHSVLEKYIEGYAGVIDISENASRCEIEQIMRAIEEEVFADAYAGINSFSAHAEQISEIFNKWMDDNFVGKQRNVENGVREIIGLPAPTKSDVDERHTERYSYDREEFGLRCKPNNMPTDSREWRAFNRSFANETSDIKHNEERAIGIYTAGSACWVTADGYMQGYAEAKIPITESNRERIRHLEDEFF